MKYAFWGFGFIMIGLFGLFFIILFQDVTINNEVEYYVLKEAMAASMLESVDFACYRIGEDCNKSTDLKMSEQKFVENFTKRFAKSISGTVQNYTIEFYDIIERPPKATVVVKGKTKRFGIFSSEEDVTFDLTNNISGILEIDNNECEYTDYFLFVLPIDNYSVVKTERKSSISTTFLYQALDIDNRDFEVVEKGRVELVKENAGDNQMSLNDFYKYYKNSLSDNSCENKIGFYCSSLSNNKKSINARYFIQGYWEDGINGNFNANRGYNYSKDFYLEKEIAELVNMTVLPHSIDFGYDMGGRKYYEDCLVNDSNYNKLECIEQNNEGKYNYISDKFYISRDFSNITFGKGDFLSPALYKITYDICK